jgi:hypothetical protein
MREHNPQIDIPIDFKKTEIIDKVNAKYKQDYLVDEVSDILNYLKNLRI